MTRLETLAKAIEKHEGFYFMSRSWRNNNPGNLRFSKFQNGQRDGFAFFNSYASGWLALWWDLMKKCKGETVTGLKPTSQLKDLIRIWAPPADGNDVIGYIASVCKNTGVSPDTPLSWFLEDII